MSKDVTDVQTSVKAGVQASTKTDIAIIDQALEDEQTDIKNTSENKVKTKHDYSVIAALAAEDAYRSSKSTILETLGEETGLKGPLKHKSSIEVLGEANFQAYIYHSELDNLLLVAFRGTAGIQDAINDFNSFEKGIAGWLEEVKGNKQNNLNDKIFPSTSNTRVAEGFQKSYVLARSRFIPSLKEQIMALDPGQLSVVFTGHSLGAALSMFALLDVSDEDWFSSVSDQYLIAFGLPELGNVEFNTLFNQQTKNVHKTSYVTYTPSATISGKDIVASVDMGFKRTFPDTLIPKQSYMKINNRYSRLDVHLMGVYIAALGMKNAMFDVNEIYNEIDKCGKKNCYCDMQGVQKITKFLKNHDKNYKSFQRLPSALKAALKIRLKVLKNEPCKCYYRKGICLTVPTATCRGWNETLQMCANKDECTKNSDCTN